MRSFYTDLHSWAVEEPEMWAPWVAPCPIPGNALRGLTVHKRRTKERMDDRTRLRQPLLPTLVAHLEDRYHHLRVLLQQASPLAAGEAFVLEDLSYRRSWSPADDKRQRRGGDANVRVRDLTSEKDVNVTTAEELAFWEWAAVEVLRHSGIRIEELLELTHLSVRQYQRPNGEVIALLVIAPSKTDRERVIPMSAELFAVIAAIVRRHTQGGRVIPLIQRYDQHERRMSEPMPFLFQRQLGTTRRVISPATVQVMLRRRCNDLADSHPEFGTAGFTPHDFRRLLATDLVNNGLPIHIGAALLGHLNLQTTRGYVAVFNEDVVRHYQAFLDRRRQARPADEYRTVTQPEWLGFEEHFDQRKVELGGCARPYGTPCQHEHACLRCPMININPKMLPRLDEIEDDLQARRSRAATRGLARRDRGYRPHPHLPPPETGPDPAAGPHRAHRPRHARRARHRVTMSSPASSGPRRQARLDKVQRNFERRKVSLGDLRPGLRGPLRHEHAASAAPSWPDPAQRARLEGIRDNLTARIAEAEREGWLGEAEGLRSASTRRAQKLAQLDERARRAATVHLGMPGPADTACLFLTAPARPSPPAQPS